MREGNPLRYSESAYSRRKRRRDRERRTKIIVGLLAVLLAVGVGVFGARKLLKSFPGGGPLPGIGQETEGTTEAAAAVTTEPETELRRAVLINDVDIAGMSKDEARKAVIRQFPWGMKAELENPQEGDEPVEISNLLSLKLEKILSEIYSTGGNTKDAYLLNAEGMDDEIAAEVAALGTKWNVKAKNGAVASFDKSTSSFSYTESKDGRTIRAEETAAAIRTAMNEQNYQSTIKVTADIQPAELTAAQAKERYKVIGTFSTQATANSDRNNNLKLACEAIDGLILQVGEEFSFNKTTGNRTTERGYKPAGAYQNGKVVLEPGGGVCQVSSTLYNAVIRAGLTPTERHAHTFEPSYVTPGEDATVSYDGYAGPDMRFVNTTDSAIAIRASFYDRTVTASIVGLPILEDGVTITLKSKKTDEFDNGGVEYVEDTTLQPGVENVISGGSIGSRWVTNLVTKKDGEVISDVFFHNSTYKGHAKTIARNTSGVVTLPEGSTEALTIVENTETVPEQAADSSTEAAHIIMVGPGESISVGGPGGTVEAGPSGGSSSQTAAAHPEPSATESAAPRPAQTEAQAPETAAEHHTEAQTVPASPGPSSQDSGSSGGPGGQSETISAGPGPSSGGPSDPGGSPGNVGPGGPGSSGGSETVAPFPGG